MTDQKINDGQDLKLGEPDSPNSNSSKVMPQNKNNFTFRRLSLLQLITLTAIIIIAIIAILYLNANLSTANLKTYSNSAFSFNYPLNWLSVPSTQNLTSLYSVFLGPKTMSKVLENASRNASFIPPPSNFDFIEISTNPVYNSSALIGFYRMFKNELRVIPTNISMAGAIGFEVSGPVLISTVQTPNIFEVAEIYANNKIYSILGMASGQNQTQEEQSSFITILNTIKLFNYSENITDLTRPHTIGFNPFKIISQQCSATNGLMINLENNAGTTITLENESITNSTGIIKATNGNLTLSQLANNAIKTIGFGGNCIGLRYSASITLIYTEPQGSQTFNSVGTVQGIPS